MSFPNTQHLQVVFNARQPISGAWSTKWVRPKKNMKKTMMQVGSSPSHALFWREISWAADSHATCSCSGHGSLPAFPSHKKQHFAWWWNEWSLSPLRKACWKKGRQAKKQHSSCQFCVLLLGKRVPWTRGKWPGTTNNEDKPTRFSWQETKLWQFHSDAWGLLRPKMCVRVTSKISLTLVFAGLRPN